MSEFIPVFAEYRNESVECTSCENTIPPGNKVCFAKGEVNPVCETCIEGWTEQNLYQESPSLPPYKFVENDWRKSPLKIRTETTNYIDYMDLENFIRDHLGISFEVPMDLECGNDTDHHFDVDPKYIDYYDRENLAKLLAGNYTGAYMTGTLLNYLAEKELIPKGDYVLRVSW